MSKEIKELQAIEAERPLLIGHFKIAPKMISIDAPDGSGKSTFSKVVEKYINEKLGFSDVVLVRPTYFNQSAEGLRLEEELKRRIDIKPNSYEHNNYFMATMAANYKTVISPILERGGIVVLDSSEIRSIAFMLHNGEPSAIESTLNWVESGKATNNTFSGIRVRLITSPHDCLHNLFAKGKLDSGDPKSIDESIQRNICYEKAFLHVKSIQNHESSVWIDIENPSYRNHETLIGHLNEVIEQKLEPTLLKMLNSRSNFVENGK